jgi:hypothetical protein
VYLLNARTALECLITSHMGLSPRQPALILEAQGFPAALEL